MFKTSFTCNSLKLSHLFNFLWIIITTSKKKLHGLFHQSLASYFGISKDNIFLFGSGRMGLFTVLDAIEHTPENEVIVAGYTCVVVTNAIKYAEYKAVYVDIDEQTLNISTDKIRSAITSNTKAIIIPHNFGIVYEDIQVIKSEFSNIIIIEDAAHTFTSIYINGQKTGLQADASFFSLEYSKPLTTGMGGILIVNNYRLCKIVSEKYQDIEYYPGISNFKIFVTLKTHLLSSYKYSIFLKGAMLRFLNIFGLQFQSSEDEIQGEMPANYPVRLSPYLSVIGFLQIKNILEINNIKYEIAKNFHSTLEVVPGITMFYSNRYNYVRYPILFEKSISFDEIENIKKDLAEAGILAGEWFNDVVHPKGSFRYCYIDGFCKTGESVSKRIINLPVSIHWVPDHKELSHIKSIFERHLN